MTGAVCPRLVTSVSLAGSAWRIVRVRLPAPLVTATSWPLALIVASGGRCQVCV